MIHEENPFADEPGARDPVRRFRGRLGAPVTVVTAGSVERSAGLTVSSLVILEGEPGRVEMVVGPTADLWDVVEATGRFVIHICTEGDRHLAEVFAGLRPSPGGIFAGVALSHSEWGPVLEDLSNRAFCVFEDREEVGYSGLIRGRLDHVEVDGLTDPLLYFRGGYRGLV